MISSAPTIDFVPWHPGDDYEYEDPYGDDSHTNRHPLAPDKVSWSWSPDGEIVAYGLYGKYLVKLRSFVSGYYCSESIDKVYAENFCRRLVATGKED